MNRIFLCLLIPILLFSQVIIQPLKYPGAGGAPTYLFDESFDTNPGYDEADWLESGSTINEDYETIILEGTQSILLDNSASGAPRCTTAYWDSTAAEQWVVFMVRFTGSLPGANCETVLCLNRVYADQNFLFGAQYRTSITAFRFNAGGSNIDTRAISADTTYYLKVRHEAIASGTSELQVWMGTSAVDSYQLQGQVTDCAEYKHMRFVIIAPSTTVDIVVDDIRVDDVDIPWAW